MPRFFMHICNGSGFVEDLEGVELQDERTARASATAAARDVMMGDIRDGRLDLSSFIEVEDEEHKLLFTLTFADAVRVTGRRHGRPGKRPPIASIS
jgi:hypothetical protein